MGTIHHISMATAACIFILTVSSGGHRVAANERPVADAGLARYAAADPVRLDGSGSYDPDNSGPLSYTWSQVSGLPLVITSADTTTPTVSGFVQTGGIQECVFQLVVSDGELASRADTTRIVVVPAFGNSMLKLENASFDPDKSTFIYFGGGDCVLGYTGQPWGNLQGAAAWLSKANVIGFPDGYVPDSSADVPTYYKYGDMIITYLSAAAPDYKRPVQTAGWSTGGQPAIDVAIRLNSTYRDARYAVNRVSFLDATPFCREYYQECIDRYLACPADGEQCWIDNYVGTASDSSSGNEDPALKSDVLNMWFQTATDTSLTAKEKHRLVRNWYCASLSLDDAGRFNHGVVAGAHWSVVGPGRNLQLASTPDAKAYCFTWYGDASSGRMELYDETNLPARLPEPVTLVGPSDGVAVGADGAVLSCRDSENAVGYQLLFGRDPFHMIYVAADTLTPPSEVATAFPFQKTWWTIRARDRYGSTIYADPVCLTPENVVPQTIADASTSQTYASIQEAINDAHDGDEIVLGPGVCRYWGNLDFKGKNLTLRSVDPNNASVVGATILVGDGTAPILTLWSGKGEATTLDGLTITGGAVGVSCRDASPTIRNCTVSSNGPVAIEFWYGYEPRLVDCTLLGQVTEGGDPYFVAYWKLDETAGTIAHDSVGGNDATVIASPPWQPEGGKVGGALQLIGPPSCIMTKLARDPAQAPLSVFAWVKGGAPGQVILSQKAGGNWLRAGAGTGALTTELKRAAATSKPLVSSHVITDGAWHRVGLVWDGSNRILYVDDVEVARDTQASLAGSSGNLSIGTGSTMTPASFWKGLIDDVRIYDRAVRP